MDRRAFVTGLGAVLAAPPTAEAQPAGKVVRLGRLSLAGTDAQPGRGTGDAIVDGLRELGYVEGRDFILERRDANGVAEHLPKLAEELVRIPVDILLVTGVTANGCGTPSDWNNPYRLYDGRPGGPRFRQKPRTPRNEHYRRNARAGRRRSWRKVPPVSGGSGAAPRARWISQVC